MLFWSAFPVGGVSPVASTLAVLLVMCLFLCETTLNRWSDSLSESETSVATGDDMGACTF